ncbi:MAG: KTSC domain-containing protein [Chloroherpetonaceae bacterium]
MNPRELITELVQAIQLVIDSGEVLSDDIQGMLAQTLLQLLNRMDSTGIPEGSFPSSNVNGFQYDPKNQELLVQFHGPYPQAAGPVYRYAGVPQYIFNIISRGQIGPLTSGRNRYHAWHRGITPSLGAAVNALLKAGNYQYERIS